LTRKRGSSREGAISEGILDRYTDFVVLGTPTFYAVAVLGEHSDYLIGRLESLTPSIVLMLGLVALFGFTIVPYVRAKSEAEGKASVPSFGDRGWRNRILIAGLLMGQPVWTLGAVALVANFYALHRLIIALRKDWKWHASMQIWWRTFFIMAIWSSLKKPAP